MNEHHAVLYLARHYREVAELAELDHGSPDVRIVEESPLSIATVRRLIEEAYRRPFRDEVMQFVISTKSIAPEAQQALLKILEEPPATTRFTLVLPSDTGLLPTVLSRLSQGPQEAQAAEATDDVFEEFLTSSYGDRLLEVAARTKAKDDAWMEAIFSGTSALVGRGGSLPLKQAAVLALGYKDLRGASRKMLLEHLALRLPVKG